MSKKYTKAELEKGICMKIGGVCPENGSPPGLYCPEWTEYIQENPKTGEVRAKTECLSKAAPNLWIEVIKASNRPAAQIGMMQTGIQKAVVDLAEQSLRLVHAKTY